MPATVCVALPLMSLTDFNWCLVTFLGWGVFLFVAAVRLLLFLCPRCGKSFSFAWFKFTYPFNETCPHCGLKIGSEDDTGHTHQKT
jgi:hypothetical protein